MAHSENLSPVTVCGIVHFMPTPTLFACGHPNAGMRGPNGECIHPDHYRAN